MLEGMTELAAIGAAIGCPIAESGEERMAVTARLGAFKTSMLQDVEAGRPIELEALLGAPREIARARGIATPRNGPALRRHQADGRGPRLKLTRPPGRRIRRSRSARALALAPGPQGHFVAVLEEAARLAAGKLDRLLAAVADLEQRAEPAGVCRSTSVPVPIRSPGCRLQPLDAVVGDDLRRAPVHRRIGRAARQDMRREARRAHLLGRQGYFELDAERALLPVGLVVKIGQRLADRRRAAAASACGTAPAPAG